ncbi:hypothetical protein T484DRAFT_1757123 [Baffinella frigidus]|nr:hypothetical protein T484DRAFT_1757123 [Cryptophyta sp. CCMP2293]
MVFIEIRSSGRIVQHKYEPLVCDPSGATVCEKTDHTPDAIVDEKMRQPPRLQVPHLRHTPDAIVDEKMRQPPRLQVPHLRQPPETIVRRYYESIRPTFTSRVTTFTNTIPWFTESQNRYFNVDLFAKHIFQKVSDFEGVATGSIAARDFCLPFQDAQTSRIRDIMTSAPTPAGAASVVQTLDFDQIEAESESLGMLSMRDLQPGLPIYPSTQQIIRLSQTEVNPGDIGTIFDSSMSDSSNITPPLLSSSRALWGSICESRYDVDRLFVMTAAVKTAEQLMLSSIIVVDDLYEMLVVASVLRRTMKAYDIPVCEFFVGVIWCGDSATSINKTKEERIRQLKELRETLTARGIVVTLRRTPVLNALVEALVYYKMNKNESPGNSFCYHDEVSKFNTSVALLKSVERVIDLKKERMMKHPSVDSSVSTIDKKQHPSVDSSVSTIDKKHRSRKEQRKAARRIKRSPHHTVVDPISANVSIDTAAVSPVSANVSIDTAAVSPVSAEWASWDYKASVVAECTQEPMDDQTLSELAYRDDEIEEDERRACQYRHPLVIQQQRLVGINLPCCLGFILIMDDKDDDDNDQDNPVDKSQGLKKHIDVLCGRLDPYHRMPKPHCTVMLTHAPPSIKNTGFA